MRGLGRGEYREQENSGYNKDEVSLADYLAGLYFNDEIERENLFYISLFCEEFLNDESLLAIPAPVLNLSVGEAFNNQDCLFLTSLLDYRDDLEVSFPGFINMNLRDFVFLLIVFSELYDAKVLALSFAIRHLVFGVTTVDLENKRYRKKRFLLDPSRKIKLEIDKRMNIFSDLDSSRKEELNLLTRAVQELAPQESEIGLAFNMVVEEGIGDYSFDEMMNYFRLVEPLPNFLEAEFVRYYKGRVLDNNRLFVSDEVNIVLDSNAEEDILPVFELSDRDRFVQYFERGPNVSTVEAQKIFSLLYKVSDRVSRGDVRRFRERFVRSNPSERLLGVVEGIYSFVSKMQLPGISGEGTRNLFVPSGRGVEKHLLIKFPIEERVCSVSLERGDLQAVDSDDTLLSSNVSNDISDISLSHKFVGWLREIIFCLYGEEGLSEALILETLEDIITVVDEVFEYFVDNSVAEGEKDVHVEMIRKRLEVYIVARSKIRKLIVRLLASGLNEGDRIVAGFGRLIRDETVDVLEEDLPLFLRAILVHETALSLQFALLRDLSIKRLLAMRPVEEDEVSEGSRGSYFEENNGQDKYTSLVSLAMDRLYDGLEQMLRSNIFGGTPILEDGDNLVPLNSLGSLLDFSGKADFIFLVEGGNFNGLILAVDLTTNSKKYNRNKIGSLGPMLFLNDDVNEIAKKMRSPRMTQEFEVNSDNLDVCVLLIEKFEKNEKIKDIFRQWSLKIHKLNGRVLVDDRRKYLREELSFIKHVESAIRRLYGEACSDPDKWDKAVNQAIFEVFINGAVRDCLLDFSQYILKAKEGLEKGWNLNNVTLA